MSLISKFYKTLPILGLATLSVLSSMSISSCSDKDPTDYVGNANGTDWKGYISGTLEIEFSESMHCCSIKNADTYVAHNLYIPKEVKLGEEKYVLTRIGGAAFEDPNSGNNQLISGKLFFPEKCTEIGVQAFIKCIELTDVDLFNVENIDIGAFGGCVKITSINLNGQKFNHDKALGNNCFSNCTNLSSISLFKSIKNIGSYCFLNIKDSCILSLNDLTQGQSSCGYQIQAITTWWNNGNPITSLILGDHTFQLNQITWTGKP